MAWEYFAVELELLSPLHIGFHPVNRESSLVSRTRLYVPARTMWGAVTNSVTNRLCSHPTAAQYRDVGETISLNCRFSYFVPAVGCAELRPAWTAEGLRMGHLDYADAAALLLGTLSSTQIGKRDHRAEDSTLHEIEYVTPLVRSPDGGAVCRLHLCGGLWLRVEAGQVGADPPALHKVPLVSDLSLGGERTSGWGRVDVVRAQQDDPPKGWSCNSQGPIWTASDELPWLPAHCPCADIIAGARGQWEAVASRQWPSGSTGHIGKATTSWGYCWVPGTRVAAGTQLSLGPDGMLRHP